MSITTKSKLVIYSEHFSLWSTILMCGLVHVPFYQKKLYKINLIINIIKSLNFINCDYKQVFHHIASLFISLILYNSRPFIDNYMLNDFNVGIKANISTIFLILMHQKKNTIYKILFALTFFIYRIPVVYVVIRGVRGVDYVCTDNIVDYYFCYYYFKFCYLFLACLNVYWMYLIILKMKKLIKQ